MNYAYELVIVLIDNYHSRKCAIDRAKNFYLIFLTSGLFHLMPPSQVLVRVLRKQCGWLLQIYLKSAICVTKIYKIEVFRLTQSETKGCMHSSLSILF